MPAKLIKGDEVAESIRADLANELNNLYEKTGLIPGLAVVIVGENPASMTYVANKEKQSRKIGFYSQVRRLPEDISQDALLEVIAELNEDSKIHGFMVQLPLPDHIDERTVLQSIDPEKDIDGTHPVNMGKLFSNEKGFIACTANSIMHMIEHTRQPVYGKSAVLIGRSNIVGKPLALLLLRRNASVTICHSKSLDLSEICREADILVAAAGSAELVKGDWIKPGAIVIDVGVTQDGDRVLGDVEFEKAQQSAGWISPVPGGVGPITITMLMQNALEAFKQQIEA